MRRTRSHLTTLLCVLAIVAFARHAPADYILDTKTYTSPSGEYTLTVEPSERGGFGPSTVTLKRNGETVYEREYEFTLWLADVADTGAVAGASYRNGLQSFPPRHMRQDPAVEIVIFDEQGEIIARDAHERKHNMRVMSNPPSPLNPTISGVHALPEQDVVLVRPSYRDEQSPVSWWRYRLSTGEALDPITPDQPESKSQWSSPDDTKVFTIPGTPLQAVHWTNFNPDFDPPWDVRVSVVTSEGLTVFSRDYPGDYDEFDDQGWHYQRDLVARGIDQLSVAEKSFSFRSFAENAITTFSCAQDGDRWVIEETDRTPTDDASLFLDPEQAAPELKPITLPAAGRLKLNGVSDFGGMALGPGGLLHVIDSTDGSVRVFDKSGDTRRVLRCEEGDFQIRPSGGGRITVDADGVAHVIPCMQYSPNRDVEKGYLTFDAEGNRLGFEPLLTREVREAWLHKPDGSGKWVLGYHVIMLVDEKTGVPRVIRKAADGRWFGTVEDGCVASDGSLALISFMDEGWAFPSNPLLNIYDPDGNPVRAYEPPSDVRYGAPAFVPPYVVVWGGTNLYIYDIRTDDPPRVMTIAHTDGNAFFSLYPGIEPNEILVHSDQTEMITRLRLPDP